MNISQLKKSVTRATAIAAGVAALAAIPVATARAATPHPQQGQQVSASASQKAEIVTPLCFW
ncbi:hypothetical protein [Streptantibioticus ferralitis]|uniref:Uncharacterized protein n=1 Tax=Streptantibioticus ferralitis TaxID=236510 RepID=A0ABT5ZAY8_9ACTN|nr:hypothetical protein [Streptantibioticus ferralitis]MDF2261011.1 hypothetical protein [Streptantibioticus ferralitis]